MAKFAAVDPSILHRQREVTERQKSMPGITWPSFLCRCCGQHKLTQGRVQVVKGTSKFGYKCAACANGGGDDPQ